MELVKNRYALVPYGQRYAARDNNSGELLTDAAGVIMTRDGQDATDWLYAMNRWARQHNN